MRQERTAAEARIVDRIAPILIENGITTFFIDEVVTDKPDILVKHDSGSLGIEISRLDYEEYCKWQATPSGPEYSRAAEVTVNLKTLFKTVLDNKRDKYQRYMEERNLSECWLVLHNDLFEFAESGQKIGVPDRKWFEEISWYELQDLACPFEKVMFNLDNPNKWYTLFDKRVPKTRLRQIKDWPTIIKRECAIITHRGVNVLNLSDAVPRESFD